jgi:hypothetical protein
MTRNIIFLWRGPDFRSIVLSLKNYLHLNIINTYKSILKDKSLASDKY